MFYICNLSCHNLPWDKDYSPSRCPDGTCLAHIQDDLLKGCESKTARLLTASHASLQRLITVQTQMRKFFVWLLQLSRLEMNEDGERILVPIETEAVLEAIQIMRNTDHWPPFFQALVSNQQNYNIIHSNHAAICMLHSVQRLYIPEMSGNPEFEYPSGFKTLSSLGDIFDAGSCDILCDNMTCQSQTLWPKTSKHVNF